MSIIEHDMIEYLNELVVIANNVEILSRKTMTTAIEEVEEMAAEQAKMAGARSSKIKECIDDFQGIIDGKAQRMSTQECRFQSTQISFDSWLWRTWTSGYLDLFSLYHGRH